MSEQSSTGSDFVAIVAKEDGVNIIGLTRGGETRFIIQKSWMRERCISPSLRKIHLL